MRESLRLHRRPSGREILRRHFLSLPVAGLHVSGDRDLRRLDPPFGPRQCAHMSRLMGLCGQPGEALVDGRDEHVLGSCDGRILLLGVNERARAPHVMRRESTGPA